MLNGDRVVLRPIERTDLPRLWQLIWDLEVAVLATSSPVQPRSLEFEATFDHDPAQPGKDRAYFAIELDGELIGEAASTGSTTSGRTCELGIGIGRAYCGKGFGQDAVRTLLDYAFEHLNMNRVGLYVLAEDSRAVDAYRKAGFVEEGRIRQHAWVRRRYQYELVIPVLREEWTPSS